MEGYSSNFLGTGFTVDIPGYESYKGAVAMNKETQDPVLPYTYYSVVQHKLRKVPILSASNIDRSKFCQAERGGDFGPDDRLEKFVQLSTEDYKLMNSIVPNTIDKGHMTKREDVQWDEGKDVGKAVDAALSTFFYTNAAPQHKSLNRAIWKNLENSVLNKHGMPDPKRATVFTGPVIAGQDPVLKTRLASGATFQIPLLFWKVIYYLSPKNELRRAGFIMSHYVLLKASGLIDKVETKGMGKPKTLKPFLEFKDDEKYQVDVALIEQLTRLTFNPASDPMAGQQPGLLTGVQEKGKRRLRTVNFEIRGLQV